MREDPGYTNVTVVPRYNCTMLMLISLRSGLSPEIVHFRIESDGISDCSAPQDWYIKGAACVPLSPWGGPRGLTYLFTALGTDSAVRCTIHPSVVKPILRCSLLGILKNSSFHFRPETVESLFIAFRLTGDERFRKLGWDIFQAIETHCRVETGGYSSVWNVDAVPVMRLDNMETFFLVRKSAIYAERAGY